MEKYLKTLNNQLDRANDFRYFALLGSFVFFLDYLSILKLGVPILQLDYATFSGRVKIGEALVFFLLFAFFLSFFVPLVRLCLTYISLIIPYSLLPFLSYDSWENINPKDYYYEFQVERYAIKNNNSIAYQHYQNLLELKVKREQLYHYCLAFLLATLLDYYAYTINDLALFYMVEYSFNRGYTSVLEQMYSLPIIALYLFCFYFGIIRGCKFSLQSDDKHLMTDNEF